MRDNWTQADIDAAKEHADKLLQVFNPALLDASKVIEVQAAEIARLHNACRKQAHEIEQILGRALGFPRYADDPANFPGATDADGVCVGHHVAETLAATAALKIEALERERDEMLGLLGEAANAIADCHGPCGTDGRGNSTGLIDRIEAARGGATS